MHFDCDDCCGSGQRSESDINASGQYRGQVYYECPTCEGSGILLEGSPGYKEAEERRLREVQA